MRELQVRARFRPNVEPRLSERFGLIAAALIASSAPASAQVKEPVAGSVAVTHAISDVQAQNLSQVIRQRPSRAILFNPKLLHDIAGTQAAPVDVSGSKVVPAEPNPAPPAPAPSPAPAKVELVKTTASDEALLQRAIAGHGSLQPALSSQGSSLITLPGVVRMAETEGAPLQLKPFILVSQPLQRDSNGQFTGELLIGVSEIADSDEVRRLPTPLLFEIAGAVRSVPERVLLDTTSPPFRRVRVWLNAAQGAAAKLLILSLLDKQGTSIVLPVAGELDLDTASGSIEGWGLETTKIQIALSNPGDAVNRRVSLHVEPSGYLDNSMLKLDEDGSGEAELRSDGIGTARIRATSAGLAPATATIVYRLPVRTLGASMAGGLLGALVSLMTAPQRRKKPAIRLIGASLFGVMVFALYVVGINILPLQPKVTVGAALVFAVSALAAWLGPTISTWRRKLPAA
jgi:hypothetical protein